MRPPREPNTGQEIKVGSRSQAEKLFLRLYQGHGFRNTTGWARGQYKAFGKRGTYHWDDVYGGASSAFPGRQLLKGHYDDGNLHNYVRHLQIHTVEETIIRILF